MRTNRSRGVGIAVWAALGCSFGLACGSAPSTHARSMGTGREPTPTTAEHIASNRAGDTAEPGVEEAGSLAGLARGGRAGPDAAPTLSFEITTVGASVRSAPSTRAPRRGTVRRGSRFPAYGRVAGECPGGVFVHIALDAFVCETLGAWVSAPPLAEPAFTLAPGALLPRRMAFVASDGVWGYARPEAFFEDDYIVSLGRGFGVVVLEEAVVRGVRFARTSRNVWIPLSELRFAQGSTFAGLRLPDGYGIDGRLVAWTKPRELRLDRHRSLAERTMVWIRATPNRTQHGVELISENDSAPVDAIRLSTSDLAIAELVQRPATVGDHDRWIDIKLSSQVLVAYEGDQAVYATLVSTGRNTTTHATPVGLFRIWVKLAEDTMDDLERTDQESNYAIEGVPWVQYFHEGVALHTAFWHDDFGHTHSHGCVNLAPLDAHTLFQWTQPALPDGWDAIVTTNADPGTWVQVRR